MNDDGEVPGEVHTQNSELRIIAVDDPGPHGVHRRYEFRSRRRDALVATLEFANGVLNVPVTHADLYAVRKHRVQGLLGGLGGLEGVPRGHLFAVRDIIKEQLERQIARSLACDHGATDLEPGEGREPNPCRECGMYYAVPEAE